MPRPQFSLKTMLWLMVVVAAFCAGIRFEREWKARRSRTASPAAKPIFGPPIKPPARKKDPPVRFKLLGGGQSLASSAAEAGTQE